MVRLSVNVLTSAIMLLEWLSIYHFASLSELAYCKIATIDAEDIFYFSNRCGWVAVDNDRPFLTGRGIDILRLQKEGTVYSARREMLADYVLKIAPIWSNRIPYGRCEAAIFMTKDEKACFTEANLLSEHLDSNIVSWWDNLARQIQVHSRQVKHDIGRRGEKNSINYERKRTATEPKWVAIDSNLVGYDIKSQKDKNNFSPLLIEVKASTSALSTASFHISSHEWCVASTSEGYIFHLWCFFENRKLLAVVPPCEIRPYIPTNNLEGEWENAIIPFSCFSDKFIEIA